MTAACDDPSKTFTGHQRKFPKHVYHINLHFRGEHCGSCGWVSEDFYLNPTIDKNTLLFLSLTLGTWIKTHPGWSLIPPGVRTAFENEYEEYKKGRT